MSDFKSKLPDLKELGEITGKLFKDIKSSVTEIVHSYKQKHAQPAEPATPKAEVNAQSAAPVEPAKEEKVEPVTKAPEAVKPEEHKE